MMTTRAAKKTTPKKHWSDLLVKRDACGDAIEWAKTQPSAKVAWASCARPDWMLWIAGRLAKTLADRKALVLVACACARTALQYVPEGETRPLVAIETAERWCRGEATIEEVRRARNGAWTCYYAATLAADAAYAATLATAATLAAAAADATAATLAAAAADATAYAATATLAAADAYATATLARTKAYAEMANIVRKHMSMPRLPRAAAKKKVTRAAA